MSVSGRGPSQNSQPVCKHRTLGGAHVSTYEYVGAYLPRPGPHPAVVSLFSS